MARKRKAFNKNVSTVTKKGHRPKPKKPILSYEAWWAMARKKYNFDPYMKEVLYKQFRSRGFLENGRFDEGLADYGIEI